MSNRLKVTEHPIIFGEQASLFGIVTEPEAIHCDLGVILLSAGLLPLDGPFRLHVDLARELAPKLSCRVLRIDQTGRGESDAIRVDATGENTPYLDLKDAIFQLEQRGAKRFVVVGFCSGADDVLPWLEKLTMISGVVLFDPFASKNRKFYLNHYLPRILSFSRVFKAIVRRAVSAYSTIWPTGSAEDEAPTEEAAFRDWKTKSEMFEFYKKFLDRDGKFLATFTKPFYYNYEGQLSDNLTAYGVSIHSMDGMSEIKIDNAEHTYPVVSHRREVVSKVCEWLETNFLNQTSHGE